MMRYLLFGLCLVFSVHFVRCQNMTVPLNETITNPSTASTTISTTAVGVVTNSTSITTTPFPTSATTPTVGGVTNSPSITISTVPPSTTTTTVASSNITDKVTNPTSNTTTTAPAPTPTTTALAPTPTMTAPAPTPTMTDPTPTPTMTDPTPTPTMTDPTPTPTMTDPTPTPTMTDPTPTPTMTDPTPTPPMTAPIPTPTMTDPTPTPTMTDPTPTPTMTDPTPTPTMTDPTPTPPMTAPIPTPTMTDPTPTPTMTDPTPTPTTTAPAPTPRTTAPNSTTTPSVTSSNVTVTSNDTDGVTTPATTSTVDDITTTTPTPTPTVDPCAGQCNLGQECGSDCECVNGYVKSLSSVCAKPCNPAYAWCYEGVECQPSENNMGYECVGCPPAYYENEEGDCLQGKTFGGEITFENDFDETDQEQTKKDVEDILNGIYNESESFVKSVVSNVRKGSIIATYDLIYKDDESVTDETVQRSFESQTNCSAGNTVNNTDYAINCTGSLNTVIIPGQACKSAGYCDLSTTNCEDTNGRYYCRCKDDTFAKVTPTAQECFKIPCMSSSDCNDPFGTCKNGTDNSADVLQHYCSCMWGFAGSDCSDPWMFVFTVSTSALGLILIIVVTVCICNSTKSKSKNKKGEMHDDMNLKNPFVDFQPGLVRAKVPANMYSVSDTFDMGETNGGRQSHTNNAYSHAYDEVSPKNANGQGGGADYF